MQTLVSHFFLFFLCVYSLLTFCPQDCRIFQLNKEFYSELMSLLCCSVTDRTIKYLYHWPLLLTINSSFVLQFILQQWTLHATSILDSPALLLPSKVSAVERPCYWLTPYIFWLKLKEWIISYFKCWCDQAISLQFRLLKLCFYSLLSFKSSTSQKISGLVHFEDTAHVIVNLASPRSNIMRCMNIL